MTPTAAPAAPSAEEGARTRADAFRERRGELCAALLARAVPAAEFPERYTALADGFLAELFARAAAGRDQGYALVAVGGHGRGALCPNSDFDLVLLHRRRRNFQRVAEALWYETWDAGVHLDHSVRTRHEALALARTELRVVLGLLDGRLVAGSEAVAAPVLRGVRELWQRGAPGYLRSLESGVADRHKAAGELAYLLEPDLKLSAGGLRDAAALRALAAAYPQLGRLCADPAFTAAERLVTSVRCVLHAHAPSAGDRLALQEQDAVADVLGFASADALMGALAEAGRTIAARGAEGWRRARAILRAEEGAAPPGEVAIAPGIVLRAGEVALSDDARPKERPELLVEVALAAAERNALLEPESVDRLARETPPPRRPWPDALRASFIALLATGDALVPVVEALDERRLFELLVPEWRAVRNRPQRNAFHRYTVDRHLLEAVARASEHLDEVERPDLLLLAALLHDIGKGFPGDHSEVGKEIAEQIGHRIGLDDADCEVLVAVVAYHLVLAEFATRRDLDDPSTAALVAKLVRSKLVLHLLAALTEADSRATGTAAWGLWKAELVHRLVERVEEVLDGRPLRPPPIPQPSEEIRALLEAGRLAVRGLGHKVTVVAPDREGLLALVTGVLSLRGCNVRRASAYEGSPKMAVEVFDVDPVFAELPRWEDVEADLLAASEGRLVLAERLAVHERTYARGRRAQSASPAVVRVSTDARTSDLATIVEVRAPDRVGLLHHVTECLAALHLDVASALVDTLGHEVIDTFYVREAAGDKPTGADRLAEVRARLEEVARGA